DYTRVVANLWVADSQGMQLGLLAPGWLHGCLGLYFAFNRRPLYRQLRFVLFAVALLLPVLSALGFIALGREISTNAAAAAAAQATLQRIGATPDVRLACQLRPSGDISVVPLVRTARPIYRSTAPQCSAEREVVVMFCDFLNRNDSRAISCRRICFTC